MAKNKKDDVHRLLHGFLLNHAREGTHFSVDDLLKVMTSWKSAGTWNTYLSKKLKPYIERDGDRYRVLKTFAKVTAQEFGSLFTQTSDPVPTWERATYDHVVSYEFLMPLTREDKLRSALDEVFFRDTIDDRTFTFNDAQREELEKVMPREQGEDDDAYRVRVADQLAELIAGYSISHVAGRFRAGNVVSRKDAALKLVEKTPYLIDETTAVVRFIMPCPNSRNPHGERFDHRNRAKDGKLDGDIDLIRTLFFLYFAEAIAATIVGEQLIWLIERSPEGERIYAWEKASDVRRAHRRAPSAPQATSTQSASKVAVPRAVAKVSAAAASAKVAPSQNKGSRSASSPKATPVARSAKQTRRIAGAETPPPALKGTVRHWLRANDYDDVADMIDAVMTEWQKAGKTTRRNWWDVLCGDADGRPCKVAGREFPVLVAAQRRQKRPITKNATQRSKTESTPE